MNIFEKFMNHFKESGINYREETIMVLYFVAMVHK